MTNNLMTNKLMTNNLMTNKLMTNNLILNLIFYMFILTDGLKINTIHNSIGKWSLLYTSDICFNKELVLDINPSRNLLNELDVKISIIYKKSFYKYKKTISFVTKDINCDITDTENIECNLKFLTSEKYIQSFGIIDFPQITEKYDSSYQNIIIPTSKIYINCNKLYIFFNNHNYIFDRIVNVPKEKENIVSQTFVLSNLLSFFIGKIFENFMHY
jgi:hypothetical protein